jgi:hypothetical protein
MWTSQARAQTPAASREAGLQARQGDGGTRSQMEPDGARRTDTGDVISCDICPTTLQERASHLATMSSIESPVTCRGSTTQRCCVVTRPSGVSSDKSHTQTFRGSGWSQGESLCYVYMHSTVTRVLHGVDSWMSTFYKAGGGGNSGGSGGSGGSRDELVPRKTVSFFFFRWAVVASSIPPPYHINLQPLYHVLTPLGKLGRVGSLRTLSSKAGELGRLGQNVRFATTGNY